MNIAKNDAPLIPAITTPVRNLKERFTLKGEPLPLAHCMTKLRFELSKDEDGIRYEFKRNGKWVMYLYTPEKKLERAVYDENDDKVITRPTTKASLLGDMMLRYYELFGKTNPYPRVLSTLATEFVAIAPPRLQEFWRSRIKSISR